MAAKKKINLEELKMEQLKKVIQSIDKISDIYQSTHLRIMLVQALNGMHTAPVSLPEGRDAIDNTIKKEDNTPVEVATDDVIPTAEAQDVVANIKAAVEKVVNTEETVEEDQEVQEVTKEIIEEVSGTVLEEDFFIEYGENQVNIKDAYNALLAVPDDETKQYIALYLSYYDGESVANITSAFSSNITSDPYELLNESNYVAFFEYFNECIQA